MFFVIAAFIFIFNCIKYYFYIRCVNNIRSRDSYTCKFNYKGGTAYGFEYLGEHNFYGSRTYTADEYVEYMKTHSDHITLKAEKRDAFFGGIREAVLRHGNKIVFNATYVLDLYRK